jgi:polyisoprenoid-binding protein YceI
MMLQKIGTGLVVTLVSCTQFLSAMEFDFRPLSSLCRIEVNLTTDFGSGKVRGTFGQLAGNLNFYPENPSITEGKVLMRSGSLRFGHAKVAHSTHTPEFLDSRRYPEISFQLKSLNNFAWHDRELRAIGLGTLTIKGKANRIEIPLSIRYHRGERRKYEGTTGDLLRIDGMLNISGAEMSKIFHGIPDPLLKEIDVEVSLTGASDRVRPFLPSRLFGR